jgi:hypothetical protein
MDSNTTIDQLFPSKWLKSSDIGSTSRTATISRIDFELIGRDQEKKAVLSFQNTTKRMILNRTNAQILANLYGKELKNWIGKRITLYCAEVQFRGAPCLAVRIREQVPGIPQEERNPAPAPKVTPPDDEPSWPEDTVRF